MRVLIDPACNILYSSFYVQGLLQLYGRCNVHFCGYPFKNLHYNVDTHIFAFVIDGKKYCIDFADSNQVFYLDFLDWADVYGKVNYNHSYIPADYRDKIIRCGCNYALSIVQNCYTAVALALLNYLKSFHRLKFSFRVFLSRYIMQAKRKTIIEQKKYEVSDNYVFFVSTLWRGQDDCNKARINFIRACLRLSKEGLIRFEGGLIPDAEQDFSGIEDIIWTDNVAYSEYLQKIQRSAICFNTPAYFGCHGWKLPEYFSMGKAILSTPFINELPILPTHGENIFYVQGCSEQAIYEGVRTLITNNELRAKLEIGATNYYNAVMSPKACMLLLLNKPIQD